MKVEGSESCTGLQQKELQQKELQQKTSPGLFK